MFPIYFFIPIGMLIGTLSGFFGIGGGIVLVPILLLAGFNPAIAVATSLMFTLGTSLSGATAHTKMGNVNWKVAAVIGTVGGLATQASNRIVIYISGRYDWLLNVLFILLLLYFAWSLSKRKNNKEALPVFKNQYKAASLIGVIVGFLAALFGIGGGFITVPLLIKWNGFHSRKAVGTSLAAIIIISIGGIIGYSAQLELDFLLGLCLIGGAFIGSPFGAKMTTHYETSEITQKLGLLYFFVIASFSLDLLASFTTPYLELASLASLILFIVYMLFDFYRHRNAISIEENS